VYRRPWQQQDLSVADLAADIHREALQLATRTLCMMTSLKGEANFPNVSAVAEVNEGSLAFVE